MSIQTIYTFLSKPALTTCITNLQISFMALLASILMLIVCLITLFKFSKLPKPILSGLNTAFVGGLLSVVVTACILAFQCVNYLYITQAAQQTAKEVYAVISNPYTTIQKVVLNSENKVTVQLGFPTKTETTEVTILGTTQLASKEVEKAKSVTIDDNLVTFLNDNKVKISGSTMLEAIAYSK